MSPLVGRIKPVNFDVELVYYHRAPEHFGPTGDYIGALVKQIGSQEKNPPFECDI